MINRKELEINLSQHVVSFHKPKAFLEQYQTPARVAANLIHRASNLDDIFGKDVVDLCAGTGMLGIAAALAGANVTAVEIDQDCLPILKQNIHNSDIKIQIIIDDVLKWQPNINYDTALLNPPFGIQQKRYSDLDFLLKAIRIAKITYSIHDASPKNIEKLPSLLDKKGIEMIEYYIDEFPISNTFPWHKFRFKLKRVMVIKSKLK